MNEFEIWIDLVCGGETLCTLFGELVMPMRPIVGERISFHQDKSSSYSFKVESSPLGFSRENIISVEVEEISHYGVRSKKSAPIFKTAVRCGELVVGSIEDAKQIRKFLSSQFGLEVDPYGITRIDE